MNLNEGSAAPFVKAMLIGDSKSGKTSSLASLVEVGYSLYVLDLDAKLVPSFFQQTLLKKNPELLKRIEYEQPRDRYIQTPEGMRPARPATAYVKCCNLASRWSNGKKPEELGPEFVFVVDTLNMLSTAAFNQAYSLAHEARDPRQWFYAAQRGIEAFLSGLWDASFECNVLVLSHITDIPLSVEYVKDAKGNTNQQPKPGTETKGFPTTIGQSLSKHVAKYTNELWTVEVKNAGLPNEKRVIRTTSSQRMDLGTAALDLPKELPADTGLATLFEKLRKL